jgi:hypothetical protein
VERQADGGGRGGGLLFHVLGSYAVFAFVSGSGDDPVSIADVPSIGPATVEDQGTVELQLVFVPA